MWRTWPLNLYCTIVLFPPARNLQHLWHAGLWLAVVLSIVSAVDLVLATRRPAGHEVATPVPRHAERPT